MDEDREIFISGLVVGMILGLLAGFVLCLVVDKI